MNMPLLDTRILPFLIAMVSVVVLSNFLVWFPINYVVFTIDLSVILTWGAFIYPLSFLVNDLTNRLLGMQQAKFVVLGGFAIAIVLSAIVATPRIATASCVAFIVAQWLDLYVFEYYRQKAWWRAPLISSFLASTIDTLLFYSLAFAPTFAILNFGGEDGSLGDIVPLLSVGIGVPWWFSLGVGDLIVKIFIALCAVAFYGLLINKLLPHATLDKQMSS